MNERFFETADLDLAATILSTLGAEIVGIERLSSLTPTIIFSRKDVLDEFLEAYWRGELRVEPMMFSLFRDCLKGQLEFQIQDESLPTGLCI